MGYQFNEKHPLLDFARFNFESLLSSRHLASTISLSRSVVSYELLIPLLYPKLRVAGDVGQLSSNDIDAVPLSMNFYTGGAETVRGYKFNNIGPGRYLKNLSFELQFPIRPQWRFIVFQDRGIASDDWGASMKRGNGAGILWDLSFVGVRMSVARAEDDPDKPIRFQIGVQSS